MTIEIIRRSDNGVLVVGKGVVSFADVSATNDQIYQSVDTIRALDYQLCDFTDVESFDLSVTEIQQLAEQDNRAARVNPHIIIAIAGTDDIVFGLSRMWEAYVGETVFDTSVFRTVEEAQRWIDSKIE